MTPDIASFRIRPEDLPSEQVIFGCSDAMQDVRRKIERVAKTEYPVLIRGESGTGKEVITRYLHSRSHLSDAPFVKLNCAAIPVHLLESELLGHERGAFTGANEVKPGLVEIANGGTLFLDEIGDMDATLQSKLLHLLQDGAYCRVGGREELRARVRIICATNRDLEAAIEERSFRQDLFYRIDVVGLQLSPLRERKQDIPQLCEHFLLKLGKKFNRSVPPLSAMTLHLLKQWNWPGNLRELENWVARYMILGTDQALSAELNRQLSIAHLPVGQPVVTMHLKEASRQAAITTERAVILKVLQANHWNRRKTAKELNMSYRSLLYKLRDAGVPPRRKVKDKPALSDSPAIA